MVEQIDVIGVRRTSRDFWIFWAGQVISSLGSAMTSFVEVLAWGGIPISALLGGAPIVWTGDVALVYGLLEALTVVVTGAFFFTPLGRYRQASAADR